MARKNKRARVGAKRARKAAKRKKRLSGRPAESQGVEAAFDSMLDVTGPAPRDLDSLLFRCGLLKAALVEFAQLHPESRVDARVRDADPRHFDWYLLHGHFLGGRTVLDAFCEETRGVTDGDRALILSWSQDAVGIFEPVHHADDHVVLHNLVDGLDYVTRSNIGASFIDSIPADGWLFGRLVPLMEGWLVSGPLSVYAPDTPHAEILQLAANMAKHHPAQVARNPERRAAAALMARDEAAFFERYFGGFETVVRGRDVNDVLTDYYTEWVHNMPKSCNGYEPHGSIDMPAELRQHERVGILFDETWGLGMYPDYDVFREAFRDPQRGGYPPFSETVLGYLESPGVDPLPFAIVGRAMPEKVGILLADLLERPGFSWESDGDALMREFKAAHFPAPLTIVPIPSDQAEAYRRQTKPLRPKAPDNEQLSLW